MTTNPAFILAAIALILAVLSYWPPASPHAHVVALILLAVAMMLLSVRAH